jgi:flagellar protein FlbD
MIQLTRLNNARLALNSDLIKYVEEAPDTVITLLNGEKLVVRETTGQVIERVLEFRRAIVSGARDRALAASRDEFTYPHCFANAPLSPAEPDRG